MFCPVGFRSAAELWDRFKTMRFAAIYTDAIRSYNEVNFHTAFSRGSPADICEHAFLKSLAHVGFHIASPSGEVMRLHVRMEDFIPNLFSASRMHEAAPYGVSGQSEADEDLERRLLARHGFQAWEHNKLSSSKMAETYKAVEAGKEDKFRDLEWSVRHHGLLNHIQRRSFTIVDDFPWAEKSSTSPYVAPILKHFVGWAVCLDETTFNDKWPEYLAGNVQLFHVDGSSSTVSTAGRPKLVAARNAFASMNYDKGELSWEQVSRKIERETGEKPSAKSLRNWREEFSKGKNAVDGSQGKNRD